LSDLKTVDCDALVIGGGITGCFIALRLAQEGLKVRLADKGPLFREASGRSGGGVRQQFRNRAELPLAMESVPLWRARAHAWLAGMKPRRLPDGRVWASPCRGGRG
jgi:glycine/D-amino acid oxidase-like deaminating enzyme